MAHASAPPDPIVNAGALPRIVPVVMPPSGNPSLSGRIKNIAVRGADTSGWLQRLKDGRWVVSPDMAHQGYRLLEDWYKDDRNPEGWAQYQQYVRDWQAGRTKSPFPLDLLPKGVVELQRGFLEESARDPWSRKAITPTTGKAIEGKPEKPGK